MSRGSTRPGIRVAFVADASARNAAGKTDWREQYAYTLAMQAYIFGFPYVYLPALRWDWVTRPKAANDITPNAPINHFSPVRNSADASYRGGGSPNQDTLDSTAWLDVRKEPVILSQRCPRPPRSAPGQVGRTVRKDWRRSRAGHRQNGRRD